MVRNKNGQINIVFHDKKAERQNKDQLNNGPFAHIDQEFSSFIGMERLKKTIKEIYATIVIS